MPAGAISVLVARPDGPVPRSPQDDLLGQAVTETARAHAGLPLLPGHFDRRHSLLDQVLGECQVPIDVRRVWLQIDQALRPSVLASAEDAREKTRESG